MQIRHTIKTYDTNMMHNIISPQSYGSLFVRYTDFDAV